MSAPGSRGSQKHKCAFRAGWLPEALLESLSTAAQRCSAAITACTRGRGGPWPPASYHHTSEARRTLAGCCGSLRGDEEPAGGPCSCAIAMPLSSSAGFSNSPTSSRFAFLSISYFLPLPWRRYRATSLLAMRPWRLSGAFDRSKGTVERMEFLQRSEYAVGFISKFC